MHGGLKISEIWCLRINPSDLYNIERTLSDNPTGGGGHTYIQVPKRQVEHLLKFLRSQAPPTGANIELLVSDRSSPSHAPERVEFWSKSAGRMRIAKQNRHRHSRLGAWNPAAGFPQLQGNEGTQAAKKLIATLGGLHIYIARGNDHSVWAGFTVGSATANESALPFANLLWGKSSPGGYWKYEEIVK